MRKDLVIAVIAFLAIGAICYGLAALQPDLPPPLPFTALGGGSEKVVMRVNGEAITERQFNNFLLQAPEQMQFFYATPEGRRILADEVVKLKALEQEGRRLGVEKDPEVAMRVEMTRANILAGSALRKIIGSPSEERIRAEYEKERKQLETRELSHILIGYVGGAVGPRAGRPLTEAEAMRKAERLAARIRGGEDFAALASAESDDVDSARNGGSLGAMPPGSMPPALEKATANLQPGQISAPVKSEFGIHIFRAGQPVAQPYDAVRDALAARIQREEAEAAMQRLQKAARVELDPKFFPPPRQRPGA
ncbi:MAG TPA: peptidylprolyl isomerase [Thermoanaerobaculia bacterium]|nr:peptidylprolyl isomerase [Thermoanaerobaculia bacterium]